jgi:hypothetical protein
MMRLTTQPHILPRLGMRGAVPSLIHMYSGRRVYERETFHLSYVYICERGDSQSTYKLYHVSVSVVQTHDSYTLANKLYGIQDAKWQRKNL